MNKIIILHHRLCGKLFKQLSEKGIVTYISLKALYNPSMEDQWLTLNAINRVLKPEQKLTNYTQKQDIKTGLKELEEYGYIRIIENIKDLEYHLDISGLWVEKEETIDIEIENTFDEGTHVESRIYTNYYTQFELDYFIKAYSECNNSKPLFQYLFFYIGKKASNYHNKDGHECYYFQGDRDTLATESGINKGTIDDYNNLLMDNKIIYVIKYDYKWKNDDGYTKQVNNIYGLYENKDTLEEEKEKFIKENNDKLYYSPIPAHRKKEKDTAKKDNKQSTNTTGGFGRKESKLVNPKVEEKTVNEKQINDGKIPVVSDKDISIKQKSTIKQNKELNNSDDFWKRTEPKKENKYIYDWEESMKKSGMIPTLIDEPEEPKHINMAELI